MITTYEQRGIEKGIEQGIEQGILRGKQQALLRLSRSKFGELPPGFTVAVEAVATEEELDALLERILESAKPADLGLAGRESG